MQRLREEERKIIYNKYKTYENEIITGEVSREDKRFTWVDLGDGVEGAMGYRTRCLMNTTTFMTGSKFTFQK